LFLGWTLLVGERLSDFSPLSYTGGLAFLCIVMHVFEYPDVMSYSDKVAGHA
jgi:hypothetical protein